MVKMTESMSSVDLARPASPFHHQEVSSSPLASGLTTTSSHAKMQSSEHPSSRHHHHHHHHSHHSIASSPEKLKRVDTLDLKSKLAAALGNNGKRYWAALVDFLTGKIDRIEFEQEATSVLKSHYGEYLSDGINQSTH